MDEETEFALTHLQKQINTLATVTGQALAMLAFEDPRHREALDRLLTHWDGITDDDASKRRIMAHLRDGADKMLAASRLQHPGPGEDDDDELPRREPS